MKTKCKLCGGKVRMWVRGLFDDRHGYKGRFSVVKCADCEFGQLSPQLGRRQISRVYEEYYPWKDIDVTNIKRGDYNLPGKDVLGRKGLLINGQYWVRPGSKVLDVGCGLGHSLLELESIKCKAYGIDPDPNAEKLAKKFQLRFHRGFIEDKPFLGENFDYVIANQVLEHTNDPVKFVKSCKQRLNENGRLVLAFPNSNSLTRRLLKNSWLHWHVPYHLNFFNKRSIERLVESVGMRMVMIKTITPNMWTNLQIRRLLQKPRMGKRDTFWDGKVGMGEGLNGGLISKLLTQFWILLEEHNYLNRIIDLLGLGESYVVILARD